MSFCLLDTDCSMLNLCVSGICVHKALFPLSYLDILMLFLVFIFSIITTIAGIGGGIFFFPILVGLTFFSPTPAVAISITLVMGLMIVRYIMSYKERHPIQDRPLINYDMTVILCPSSIIGTIFGVLVNNVLPNWILLAFILGFLMKSIMSTWRKGLKQRKKEMIEFYNDSPLIKEEEIYPTFRNFPLLDRLNPDKIDIELLTLLKEESKTFPLKKNLILILNLLILIIILLLRGSPSIESIIGLPLCGVGYWVCSFLYIPIGLIILYHSFKMLKREHCVKSRSLDLDFMKSDMQWNESSLKKSLALGLSMGFISASLGFGGTIITSTGLLYFGFEVRETTYTTSFVALFTSMAGSLQYLFAGMISFDYLMASFGSGLLGLWLAMKYILPHLKRTMKASIIIFTLAGCLVLAMVFLALQGGHASLKEYRAGKLFELRDFC